MASSVGSTGRAGTTGSASAERYDETDSGYGWVVFAGTMIALVGTLNFIYGIAAISNSKFYVRDAQYVFSDLNTWGWVLLVFGAIQIAAAFGIWAQVAGARWVGVLTASLNAIVQLLVIPSYPFLALALFTLDILIIYGLVAHGRRTV